MKEVVVAAMQRDWQAAERLSSELNAVAAAIFEQKFPDNESKVRATEAGRTTVLFASLNQPDEKLFPLILAASALRDLGAQRLILVAPYLCYMRQDKAFCEGEAVSQRVLANVLSPWIDQIVTIEPHLHRVTEISAVFPEIKATALSAATLLAALVDKRKNSDNILLVGPDQEAPIRPLAHAPAQADRRQLVGGV